MSTPIADPSVPRAQMPMTVGQAARLLGLHPQKLRRLEASGAFPPARRSAMFNRRYYFLEDVAELWKRMQERESF